MTWQSVIRHDLPYWDDYSTLLAQLGGDRFPACEQLNELFTDTLVNAAGQPIRFVPDSEPGNTPYEQQIYTSGQVNTRQGSWHDLFNALVWARYPRIKCAMNARHHQAFSETKDPQRGPVRDALTLFDECGVIVFSPLRDALESVARHSWQDVFRRKKDLWGKDIGLSVTGHAMLEKFLSPFKSMTAKALLVKVSASHMAQGRDRLLMYLDKQLAARIASGGALTRPSQLAALPLAGVPGWWKDDDQDERFYADVLVFRPVPENFAPPMILSLA